MIQDKDMMKSMMIRYKQQVDARKFPYDKLVVSLRETMGFLTRNFTNLCSSAHEPMFSECSCL